MDVIDDIVNIVEKDERYYIRHLNYVDFDDLGIIDKWEIHRIDIDYRTYINLKRKYEKNSCHINQNGVHITYDKINTLTDFFRGYKYKIEI